MAASAYPAASSEARVVGRSVLRIEDPPLLTGKGSFVADLSLPHQLHMRVVRSAYAHGSIVAIDSAAALAAPGVVAVWTSRDIADLPSIGLRGGLGTAAADAARLTPYLQPVLAREQVRYVGEPVAAVFAEDPYLAEDAADLVDVRIDELPVLLAADEPPGEFAPGHGTEADIIRKGYGDLEAAFAGAHMRRRARSDGRTPFRRRRWRPAARSPATTRLGTWSSCTAPPRCRTPPATRLARVLGRSPASVHLHEGHVGGGFGIRGELYPEDVLVCSPHFASAVRSNGSRTGASI